MGPGVEGNKARDELDEDVSQTQAEVGGDADQDKARVLSSALVANRDGGADNAAATPVTTTRDNARKSVAPGHETIGGQIASVDAKKLPSLKQRKQRRDAKQAAADAAAGVAKSESLADAMDAAHLPADPLQMTALVTRRFPDGPIFDDAEMSAFDDLGRSLVGKMWLSSAGMFTIEQALAYLQAGKFHDWLLLQPGNKLLLATLAFKRNIGVKPASPAFSLGRHMMLRTGDMEEDERDTLEQDRDEDVKESFVQTMKQTELNDDAKAGIAAGGVKGTKDAAVVKQSNAHAAQILKRVMLVLQAGLQVWDKEQQQHVDYREGDVARALAHGGRVNIRIPALSEGQTGRELTDWLGITEGGAMKGADRGGAVSKRSFGTHRMNIGENKDGKRGRFIEEGEAGAAVRGKMDSTELYGVNVSAGGIGNRDCNGDVILPDGSHGHMFIGFKPPTDTRDGALQIGMETTAPHTPSMVGYAHTAKSSEATANPESSFGGHKTDKIGDGSARKVKIGIKGTKGAKMSDEDKASGLGTNARYVDLANVNGGDWMAYLERLRRDWYEPMAAQDEDEALNALAGPRQNR